MAAFRRLLSCDAFSAACAALDGLPLLASGYDAAVAATRMAKTADVQATRGLMSALEDDGTCLLRAVAGAMAPHIAESLGLLHPQAVPLGSAEDPDLVAAVRHVAARGTALPADRRDVRAVLVSVAASLLPLSADIHALMPASARQVAGKLNIAFLAATGKDG